MTKKTTKNSYKLFTLALVTFLITACDKTTVSKIDLEVDIVGTWDLLVVSNAIDLKSGEDTNNDTDFEGQGLFFDFKSDGTYETNTSINLGSVSKSDEIISGGYTKSGDKLNLAYSFPDFGIDADISLEITELSNNSLVVLLTDEALGQAFEDNLSNLDAFTRAAAQLYLSNLVDLETRIKMNR